MIRSRRFRFQSFRLLYSRPTEFVAVPFCRLEKRLELEPQAVRRLVSAVDVTPDQAVGLAKRLRLSNKDRDRMVAMAAHAGALTSDMDARARRRSIYRLGPELFRDLVLVNWAGDDVAAWEASWRDAVDWRPSSFPLKGKDVLALGIAKGPEVGRILGRVEEWWIGEDFRPDRAACLRRLREVAARAGDA